MPKTKSESRYVKIAISLPKDLLDQIDQAAQKRNLPRSTYIAQVFYELLYPHEAKKEIVRVTKW